MKHEKERGQEMKKLLLAIVLVLCFVATGMAKSNQVNVTGDMIKDGKLTVEVDWTIDTAKYPGMSREAIRDKVRQDIKNQVVSKITAAAEGMAISLDQSNFHLVSENQKLIETRPNGTKLYDYDMQIQFTASAQPQPAPAAAPAPAKKPRYEDALNQRWDNDM